MDLALNNLQRLICHKTQSTNQPTNQPSQFWKDQFFDKLYPSPNGVGGFTSLEI